jgi:outer membrane receptor for ferrienterochelin and colicins
VARHQAVFGQGEFDLAPALSLTMGLRHDWHQRFGGEWSPRAYAVWKPAADWVLKGGIGHGYKAPTIKQISPGYREDEGPNTYFGNPDLQPETNNAIELAVGLDTVAAGAQATLFYNRVHQLIVPQLLATVAGRGQYRFENIDRAVLQGLELETHAVLPAGFRAGANATFLDARDGNGQRLEKRPAFLLGLQFDWAGGPWRAMLRAEHHADQLIAPEVVGQAMNRLPDITRVSAQLSRALDRNLSLSLGVDNLGGVQLAEKSPLFTWAEAPRTWRLALRGQW